MRKWLLMAVLTAAILLCLLPVAAQAAPATSVKIGTEMLNSTTPYYINGVGGAQGTAQADEPAGGAWNAKFESGTLTLKGLDVRVPVPDAPGQRNAALKAEGDLTIVLEQGDSIVTNTEGGTGISLGAARGTSYPDVFTIQGAGTLAGTGHGSNTRSSFGVDVYGCLVVKGGTLTGTGGETTHNSYGSYGISCMNGVRVEGGSIVGTGGEGKFSSGIYTHGTITVTGGSLTGVGGTSNGTATSTNDGSYGIYTNSRDSTIHVSGGTLMGTGGHARSNSCGVLTHTAVSDITVSGSGMLIGKGGIADTGYSAGVRVDKSNIYVTGGTLTGMGGIATSGPSYGVYANDDVNYSDIGKISITGGAITGVGGNSSWSYGLYSERHVNSITLTDCVATASGNLMVMNVPPVFGTPNDWYRWKESPTIAEPPDSAYQDSSSGNQFSNINAKYLRVTPRGGLSITTLSLPGGMCGTAYNQQLSATSTPDQWSLCSGNLPTGLSITGGAIIGTPTQVGTFSFGIMAGSSSTGSDIREYTVTIEPAPTYGISGTVTASDTGSAGLVGASVQLKNGSSNVGSAVTTGAGGAYAITDVLAGTYTIEVSHPGYETGTSPNFTISNADVTDQNITLNLITASVGDVTVSGTLGMPIARTDVVITLTNATFEPTISNYGWLGNLPAGLNVTGARTSDAVVTLTVSGTPTAVSSAAMDITIPRAAIRGAAADRTVTANANAVWNITVPAHPPQTGDSSPIGLWLALCLLGGAGALWAMRKKQRA